MKGKLFGIGVGPGDPELVTIKAINTIQNCDVIATVANGEEKMAFDIVKKYIKNKPIFECPFSKKTDENERKKQRLQIAHDLELYLDKGKTVGFITLGDPTVYSTYMYIHNIVKEDGYRTEIISGITSFLAAAATLNDYLCIDEQPLHIIPAGYINSVEEVLRLNGTTVMMKFNRNKIKISNALKKCKHRKVSLVEKCTLKDQKVIYNLCDDDVENLDVNYLSILVIK